MTNVSVFTLVIVTYKTFYRALSVSNFKFIGIRKDSVASIVSVVPTIDF